MSTQTESIEDFPIQSFRFLERKLRQLRCYAIYKAAEIAKAESPAEAGIYTVTIEHIRRAFVKLLSDSEKCLEITRLDNA